MDGKDEVGFFFALHILHRPRTHAHADAQNVVLLIKLYGINRLNVMLLK